MHAKQRPIPSLGGLKWIRIIAPDIFCIQGSISNLSSGCCPSNLASSTLTTSLISSSDVGLAYTHILHLHPYHRSLTRREMVI